jgi:hypothetical protein
MRLMKKIVFLSLVLLATTFPPGNAQKMSLLQVNKLNSEVNRVLNVFGKYSACQPGDTALKIPDEYTAAFSDDAWILNFLNPYEQDQKQVSPGEFYRFIRDSYKAGLNLKLHYNTGNMCRPVASDASNINFIVYLPFTVTAVGLYKAQKIINLNREYYAVIGFHYENDLISNIKILYIQAVKPIMNYKYTTTNKSSLAFGIYGGPGFTRIYSQNIFTDENWDAWGEFGYQAGLKMIYMLGRDIGFYSGLGLSNYRSTYEILNYQNYTENGTARTLIDPQQKTDMDKDVYYEFTSATITENNSLTYLDIPLGIRYSAGQGKLQFTGQAGFLFSFLLSSRYSATGYSDHSGYYPLYHVVLSDLPDYGFTQGPVNASGTWELNAFNLSACISLGAEMKLSDNIFLNAGPFLNYGFTDLGYDTAKHRDDYISISGDPGKLNTFIAGLMIELIYKL